MLSLGGPITVSFFLLIINAAGYQGTTSADDLYKLSWCWRVLFAIGVVFPLSVFYFRWVRLAAALNLGSR